MPRGQFTRTEAHRAKMRAQLLKNHRKLHARPLEERRALGRAAGAAAAAACGWEVYSPLVLAQLRKGEIFVPDLCDFLDLTPHQVRTAIGHLRHRGHKIRNVKWHSQRYVLEHDAEPQPVPPTIDPRAIPQGPFCGD